MSACAAVVILLHDGGNQRRGATGFMIVEAWRRCRRIVKAVLPERQVYLRNGDDWWLMVLSPRAQLVAGAAAAVLLVGGAAAGGTAISALRGGEAARQRAHYERLIAERQARLDAVVRTLSARNDPMGRLAVELERRHEALAVLLGRLEHDDAPATQAVPAGAGPLARMQAVRSGQERLLARTEAYAKSRGERLKLAFRLAGLNPSAALHARAGLPMGGPLIDAGDPRALAAVLDVDPEFAARIRHAALGLETADALSGAAADLPLGEPVADPVRSSGFGVRSDPFTGAPAFHAGQDFSGGLMSPVSATGPGVVSFTGQRTGYGATVEIDHGHGFKTRYAHLAAVRVRVGQRVALGERIGAMGSTGRSTGVHLHYEVWVNGRVQDPDRYLKAGDYVHANG